MRWAMTACLLLLAITFAFAAHATPHGRVGNLFLALLHLAAAIIVFLRVPG